MKQWKKLIMAIALLVSMIPAPQAAAVNVFDQCVINSGSKVCKATSEDNATGMVKTIINLMLFVLGIIAVIMLIHGGLKYVVSRGDPGAVKAAKDTVLYAVIGIVVALFAFTIVNFVIGNIG